MKKTKAIQSTGGRQSRPFSVTRQDEANPQTKPALFQKIKRFSKVVRLHPLFLLLGVWYAVKGELFLFLLNTLVALQHECAHAFAAAKLGYTLRKIVLMPYGAIIDGDLSGISFKDELFVAICGPLCNLLTALFVLALWWLAPTMYAFTDVAYYSSLAIALLNLLPAYPLDGGRILRCLLAAHYLLSGLYQELLVEQVGIEGLVAIAMIYYHCVSVARHPFGALYDTVGSGIYRCLLVAGEVHSLVECAHVVDGVNPVSISRCRTLEVAVCNGLYCRDVTQSCLGVLVKGDNLIKRLYLHVKLFLEQVNLLCCLNEQFRVVHL